MNRIVKLIKNCLLQSRHTSLKKYKALLCFVLLYANTSHSQKIANYISNGSFEETYNDCVGPSFPLKTARFWSGIDSLCYGGGYYSFCNLKVPINGNTFQFPHFGKSYIITTLYCNTCGRGHLRNRLKSQLVNGRKYCVKFYVNIANSSPRGMDGFGAYFGGNLIDTIKKCNDPLPYINPQIKNPMGNVISDTLNWVPITGTFTANGTEKYLLLGNFLADNAVTTASINTPNFPQNWTDVCFDDVSCIEVDVPAYAGPDRAYKTGDSTYIGRERDFAVDPACVWYQWPNMATPIATMSGLWVKPVVTTTYIVKQNLDCGSLKWDTVVVYMNGVGLDKLEMLNDRLEMYPNPADERLNLKCEILNDVEKFNAKIINNLGQLVQEEEIEFRNGKGIIKTDNLDNGVYFLTLKIDRTGTLSKRFVVSR